MPRHSPVSLKSRLPRLAASSSISRQPVFAAPSRRRRCLILTLRSSLAVCLRQRFFWKEFDHLLPISQVHAV